MQLAAELARRQVADALFAAMLSQPGPMISPLFFRSLPEELGVGAAAARQVAESDPRFVFQEGRWDLRLRAQIAEGGAAANLVRLILEYGQPVSLEWAAGFFASAAGREAAYYERLFLSLAERGEHVALLQGRLLPRAWLFVPEGDTEEDALFYGGLEDDEDISRLRPTCGGEDLREATPLEAALRIVAAAEGPVPNRALGFFVWRLHREGYDAGELLGQMLADQRVLRAPGLNWLPGDAREAAAVELRTLQETSPSVNVAALEALEAILQEPLPPDLQGFFLEDRHVELVYEIVHKSLQSVTVGELLSDVLGLKPGDRDYAAAAHTLHDLLHEDPLVLELTPTTFTGRSAAGA